MPKPVRFTVRSETARSPSEAAGLILDLDNWSSFKGWGPLPGIRSAEFLDRTDTIVGTRIRVTNTDGSTHVEEILEWDPERRLRMRIGEFPFPLQRMATHFVETFRFSSAGERTAIEREFELHPKSVATKPLLMLISLMLRRAVARHLAQMDG